MTAVSIPKIPNIIPHLPLLSPLDKAEEPKSIAVNPNGIPKIIKEIGTSSLFVGLGQMILTFILGFLVSSQLFGFGVIASIYIGIALMFSSTIIVMKLLSDNHQLDSLYGKISIGILISMSFD